MIWCRLLCFFFFFQAEDGIRDKLVTGVQTCALPILFVGGEPKVGKSLWVANLALALAAGKDRAGCSIPDARRVLVCQFELPVPQFVSRLATMRRGMGTAADHNLLVDTRAGGHLLSAPQGLNHFLNAAREAAAEVIVLDPLYSTHDRDENDTHSMAALCQSLLRLTVPKSFAHTHFAHAFVVVPAVVHESDA